MNLNRFKCNLAIDKNPAAIAFAQTPFGKIVMLLVFMLPLYFLCQWWPQAMIIIAAITFMPEHRRLWVLLGMLSVIAMLLHGTQLQVFGSWQNLMRWHAANANPDNLAAINPGYLLAGSLLSVFVLSFVLMFLVNRFQRVALLQSYVLILFLIYFILLA